MPHERSGGPCHSPSVGACLHVLRVLHGRGISDKGRRVYSSKPVGASVKGFSGKMWLKIYISVQSLTFVQACQQPCKHALLFLAMRPGPKVFPQILHARCTRIRPCQLINVAYVAPRSFSSNNFVSPQSQFRTVSEPKKCPDKPRVD